VETGRETTSAVEREDRLRGDLASLRIERRAAPAGAARRKRRPRWVVPAVVALVLAVAGYLVLGGRPQVVSVASATRLAPGESPAPLLSGSGYVVTGDRYVSIGVRVPGRIERYFVEEGQSVKQGDSLVALDDRDYRAAVQRVEASLALARANRDLAENELRRADALRQTGVISTQEHDVLRNKAEVARATIQQLEAELSQARVNLDYTVLRAPTDGVVLAKLKEVGEIAVPGGFSGSGDLIRIANLSDMRAEVDVNESDLGRVRMGGAAEVTPDAYPDARYAARVVKLYPQVDRQKGTLKIEVKILEPDQRLLPDMSARVSFLPDPSTDTKAESAVLVPSTALRREGEATYVWVVREGRAVRTTVATAGDVGDRVRVVEGLTGGEAVVVGEPPARDGQRVEIAG
jgi:RND family efflux transporter MFP subunit